MYEKIGKGNVLLLSRLWDQSCFQWQNSFILIKFSECLLICGLKSRCLNYKANKCT